VDLGALLTQAAESIGPLLEKRGQALVGENLDRLVYLRGDAGRLSQAVAFLSENASRFSPTGSAIHLNLSGGAGFASVSVRD